MVEEKDKSAENRFKDVYKEFRKNVYNYCLARLGGDENGAEDCTQEAFVVFYKRLKRGEAFENPRAFLYKTAQNITLKHREKTNKKAYHESPFSAELESVLEDKSSVDDKLILSELVNLFDSVMSEDEKKLYTMYFSDGMKINDIASELGINPHACTVRISRLRKKLKNALNDYMGE